jgi:hypothetical protein
VLGTDDHGLGHTLEKVGAKIGELFARGEIVRAERDVVAVEITTSEHIVKLLGLKGPRADLLTRFRVVDEDGAGVVARQRSSQRWVDAARSHHDSGLQCPPNTSRRKIDTCEWQRFQGQTDAIR